MQGHVYTISKDTTSKLPYKSLHCCQVTNTSQVKLWRIHVPTLKVRSKRPTCEDVTQVPHVSTRVCQSQQQEIVLGLVSSEVTEKLHRIQPTTSSLKQNPSMYNPSEVYLT